MKNENQRRKYSNIKLAGDSGVLFTALHTSVDRWNESMGCTLRTGGETDFIVANPYPKIAKKNRNILRKVTRCQEKNSERPTGTMSSG